MNRLERQEKFLIELKELYLKYEFILEGDSYHCINIEDIPDLTDENAASYIKMIPKYTD